MTFYINGEEDLSFSENPFVASYIGHSPNGGHNIDAEFDDFSLWSTSLSQSEIQDYMHCSPNGNEPGLVGYWNFEEGNGNVAFDQTTNTNDVTIIGANYSTDIPDQFMSINKRKWL